MEADEVTAKRCDESHQFEMMLTGDMPDGGYPSDSQFDDFVATVCLPAFADYIGLAFEDSRLDVYWYVPLEEGWNQGDHLVQCAVYDPLDSAIVGSLRGANR